MTIKESVVVLIIGVMIGTFGMWSFTHPYSPQENVEQEETNQLLEFIAANDSTVLVLREKVLFYEESFIVLQAKFDSINQGVIVKVEDLSTLVNSDFDNLSDSAKLAYKEKVLDNLSRP